MDGIMDSASRKGIFSLACIGSLAAGHVTSGSSPALIMAYTERYQQFQRLVLDKI